MSNTMTIRFENDDNEEIEVEIPSKREVCPDCEGHGTVLCEGMRGHAYSAEEFAEAFDQEEQADYFKRGGRYDVQCPTCRGANVVDVPNMDALTAEQREAVKAWEIAQEYDAEYDAMCRAERAMGA